MSTTTIFSVICFLLFVGIIVIKWRKYRVQRAMNLPKHPSHYPDDAMKSAREIGKFLFERADICGIYFMTSDKDTGVSYEALRDISNGKDIHIVNLIRMAHYLGCEIVIRQVGTSDTENPETTPTVYAEMISRIEND